MKNTFEGKYLLVIEMTVYEVQGLNNEREQKGMDVEWQPVLWRTCTLTLRT